MTQNNLGVAFAALRDEGGMGRSVSYTLPFTETSGHETPRPHRRRHDSAGVTA
jgi:hypothetical protein